MAGIPGGHTWLSYAGKASLKMGITITGMDEVIKQMEKLSNKSKVDDIAKKAVDRAKGKVASAMKSSIASSETGPNATGSVAASVKPTQAKVNSYGVYSVAWPTGRDSKGVRNGEKAAYLEYGTSKISARPWRSRAVSSCEAECVKIMEEVVKQEMGAE